MAAGALILAAGFSRRFGSDKRIHTLADGVPMIHATLSRYHDVFTNVAVVVRDSDSAIVKQLTGELSRRQPIIIATARAEQGMSASLGDGVRAIADWDYAFIALGDMPYVRAETLRTLDGHMRSARRTGAAAIVQPVCESERGHPVGFSREFFAQLMALGGDRGARSVIAANESAVTTVKVDDRGVIDDVDQPPG